MKFAFLIVSILVSSCNTTRNSNLQRTLIGQWRVDKITSLDSASTVRNFPEYNSVPYGGGSLFYRANEINATIALESNGQLKTKLVFTTFGMPVWTTNANMDSLILKLVNVQEQSLIADGTVDENGDLYLYEGQVKFIDNANVDWILSDGRIFRLRKESAP